MMISDPVFDAYLPKAVASRSEEELKQILKDANEHIAAAFFDIAAETDAMFAVSAMVKRISRTIRVGMFTAGSRNCCSFIRRDSG